MSLQFPNPNRFYDTTRRAVRFWGHDSAMEWSFFVTAEALKHLHLGATEDEAGMLRAFARGRRGSYDLSAADF